MSLRLLLAIARGGGSFPAPETLFGFYNGRVGSGNPQQILGISSENDGRAFTSEVGATFQVSGAGGLYDEHVAQCCFFKRSPTEYVVYLSGYDGTNWRIFRFTSSVLSHDSADWFIDNGGNAVIDLGSGGDPDDAGANFPQVEYDAGTDTERIWYTGWHSGVTTICYAERDSGGTFTKYGRVLNVGAGGAFDDAGLETGPPITIGGQKRIYYDGYDGAEYTQAWATYTDPQDAGTYTKQGAIASLTGPLSIPEGAYGSVHLHSLVPRARGGYIGMVTLFHPVGSANQREVSVYCASNDGLAFGQVSGPIIPMSTTYPAVESRENPAVIVV